MNVTVPVHAMAIACVQWRGDGAFDWRADSRGLGKYRPWCVKSPSTRSSTGMNVRVKRAEHELTVSTREALTNLSCAGKEGHSLRGPKRWRADRLTAREGQDDDHRVAAVRADEARSVRVLRIVAGWRTLWIL